MDKIYYNYLEWEDYQNGMYDLPNLVGEEDLIKKCAELLKNPKDFYEQGNLMIKKWVKSAQQNLSDKNINRRAWIGQATCCFVFKATEETTKKAWKLLTEIEQIKANATADNIYYIWKKQHLKEGSLNL